MTFLQVSKKIYMSPKKKIIILKILDIVVLLLFTKFKNIRFSQNWSNFNIFFFAQFFYNFPILTKSLMMLISRNKNPMGLEFSTVIPSTKYLKPLKGF